MKIGKLLLEGTNSLFDFEWDDFCRELENYMQKKNEGKFWKIEVNNFGWRALDGKKVCKAITGEELLFSILPNTECNFKIYNYGKGLALQNFHHDSCTGNEWYYIKPIKETSYIKEK